MSDTIFPKSMKKQAPSKMESVTLRGFAGGWNTVDDDTAMSSRYVKVLTNFHRTPSGGQSLRWGQNWFADIVKALNNSLREDGGYALREDGGFEVEEGSSIPVDSTILDQTYFNSRLINVCTNGYIVTVDDLGQSQIIWSPSIALALPGGPGFWSSGLTLIDFVPFKNTLIIHNGVDKPVTIDSLYNVTYLQDLGTGSNVNVPIGKYGCIASNYHCVAGIAGSPTEIVISAQGTSGTFPLDPAPNDAISIDVGAYAPDGAAEIRGIAGYRSFLIVFLQNISLQVQLGIYDDATPTPNHKPAFPDAFPTFGLIGSRCIASTIDNLVFAGIQGLATASRNTYVSGQLDSNLISSVVEPSYRTAMGTLTDTQKKLQTFCIYDQLSHDVLTFTPDGNVFCYTSNAKLNYKSWSLFSDMNWTCGCSSLLGRMFLSKGSKIFQSGNSVYGERYYSDRGQDRDTNWITGTLFTAGMLAFDTVEEQSYMCNVTHTSRNSGLFSQDRLANPSFWTEYMGIGINFELEMPWFEGKDPMKVKKLRFLNIGTKGTAEFTVETYVDNLYKDFDGNVIYSPVISMTFIGNDAPGYGTETEEGPYGTGRRSRDPRLFNYPAKFKSAKFRIFGTATKPLQIINFSFLYARGSYFR